MEAGRAVLEGFAPNPVQAEWIEKQPTYYADAIAYVRGPRLAPGMGFGGGLAFRN